MITISPSDSNIVDVGALEGAAKVTISAAIASYPGIAADQWFWLFMKYGDEEWVIIDPIRLTKKLIEDGVSGTVSKSTLQRFPNYSELVFSAYLRGEKVDGVNVQLINSGGGDGGEGGGGGDVIEDFETYASGGKASPFETPNMTFTGTNLIIWPDRTNRFFKADIRRGIAELAIALKGRYKRATVDLAVSDTRGAQFRCIYQNGMVDERNIGSKTFTNFEFVHDDISSFQVVAIFEDFPIQIVIDNLKLFE